MDDHIMDETRRLSRRRFAKVSFWFLIVLASLVVLTVLLHPSRLSVSEALNNVSGLLNGIVAALVAIIMSYLGVSAWERTKTGGVLPPQNPPVYRRNFPQRERTRGEPAGAEPFPEN